MAQETVSVTAWEKVVESSDVDWRVQNTSNTSIYLKFQVAEPSTTESGFLLKKGDTTTFESWGAQDVWAKSPHIGAVLEVIT